MRSISVEELQKLNPDEIMIVDIRSQDDYDRGRLEGAVHMMPKEIMAQLDTFDREKTIYVMCHTGNSSQKVTKDLIDAGFDACHVTGGYRAYLSNNLDKQAHAEEEILKQRTMDIERSLIKKFRKPIWRRFTKGIRDYGLIQEGDKIACCISGGKDSMLLAKLLQELQKHGPVKFDLVFLCMNPGYNEDNWKIIQNNARILGIPLTVFESEIFDVVAEIDKNPCYLCARMRRGYLYHNARELGCNKIALGHHFDDVIETILMGMLYSGKVETMMPKLHSQNFEGMELIRPMYLVREDDIKAWRDYNKLNFIQCACRFTEYCETLTGENEHPSKRDEMKLLIKQFRETSDVIETNIFNSVQNINLKTVIGYHKDGWTYNFQDNYEEWEKDISPNAIDVKALKKHTE